MAWTRGGAKIDPYTYLGHDLGVWLWLVCSILEPWISNEQEGGIGKGEFNL